MGMRAWLRRLVCDPSASEDARVEDTEDTKAGERREAEVKRVLDKAEDVETRLREVLVSIDVVVEGRRK